MINPNKKIVLLNPSTQRKSSFTTQELRAFQQNEHSKQWITLGYEMPEDSSLCWYITEEERKSAAAENRPYKTDHNPSEYFKISNRVDSNFIEGYMGHTESKKFFFSSIDTNYSYFKDYNDRKPVYITFDKITLYKLMDIFPTNPMKFMLKRLDNDATMVKDQAFMIMPFGDNTLHEFYKTNIEQFLKVRLNINVVRADSFLDNDIIIKTIYKQIDTSEFIIADITDNNKNCFYELGYASAMGKEIITIQRNDPKGSFFDRSHIRYINYEYENSLKFQTELEGTILSIRNRQ